MATIHDFRRQLRNIPKGTRSMADYESGKNLIKRWQWEKALRAEETPSYERLVKELADWVGV